MGTYHEIPRFENSDLVQAILDDVIERFAVNLKTMAISLTTTTMIRDYFRKAKVDGIDLGLLSPPLAAIIRHKN